MNERPQIGDTRGTSDTCVTGHGVVFTYHSRDHYNAKGQPKTPLTLTRAEQIVLDHNSGLTGREYKRCRLVSYVCSVCHQYHVGHVAPRGRQ